MNNSYLMHYGIKGQKHGVRKVPWYPIADYQAHLDRVGGSKGSIFKKKHKTAQSEAPKEPEKDLSDEVKNYNHLKDEAKKKIADLTDEELRSLKNRLDLEKSVNDALQINIQDNTPKEPKKKTLADKIEPVSNVAKQIANLTESAAKIAEKGKALLKTLGLLTEDPGSKSDNKQSTSNKEDPKKQDTSKKEESKKEPTPQDVENVAKTVDTVVNTAKNVADVVATVAPFFTTTEYKQIEEEPVSTFLLEDKHRK